MLHDMSPSANRDQFIADVAVKLERLRLAVANVESAMPEWRDQYAKLDEKVTLVIDGHCRGLEIRLGEIQEAVDGVTRRQGELEPEARQINGLRSDIRVLQQRLSDPTRGASYATHDLISKLGGRLETLEQNARSAVRSRRGYLALAMIALLAVTWGALSGSTPLRLLSSQVSAGFFSSAAR